MNSCFDAADLHGFKFCKKILNLCKKCQDDLSGKVLDTMTLKYPARDVAYTFFVPSEINYLTNYFRHLKGLRSTIPILIDYLE